MILKGVVVLVPSPDCLCLVGRLKVLGGCLQVQSIELQVWMGGSEDWCCQLPQLPHLLILRCVLVGREPHSCVAAAWYWCDGCRL